MERSYFAGANTTDGFVSYYDRIFGSCDMLYIIKGGSGTGKSRLMKDIADEAEKSGKTVEYFYCSFDPLSLDGIIIDGDLAVIDGTAPHVYEPTLPGVKENIIDLGVFWDPRQLRDKKADIESLVLCKKRCFDIAYSFLASAGSFDKARRNILKKYIKRDKLEPSAAKLISEAKPSFKGESKIRLVSSLGMKGRVRFDSFNNSVKREMKICDDFGVGYLYLDAVKREAERFGASTTVSYDPLFAGRISELVFGNSILLTLDPDGDKVDFIENIPEHEAEYINELNRDIKKYEEKASEYLARASEFHFEIEKLYVSAMDFDKKEKFTSDFINDLKMSGGLDKK